MLTEGRSGGANTCQAISLKVHVLLHAREMEAVILGRSVQSTGGSGEAHLPDYSRFTYQGNLIPSVPGGDAV